MSDLPLYSSGVAPVSGDIVHTPDGVGMVRWTLSRDGRWQSLVSYNEGDTLWWDTDELERA